MPYDPRIGATLSSHEVAQGYREVEDPSIFVRFTALDERDTYFLVWTTTPWTLPSNLLLAVHPDVEYAWVKRGNETLILAKSLVPAVLKDEAHEIVRTALGRELDGLRYERLFDYLPRDERPRRSACASAEFVTTEDGTGIVHIAPAYGEDDLKLGNKYGAAGRARRRRGRLLPDRRDAGGGQVLQGRRSDDHRDPARARPAVPRAEVPAQLSVRLALRRPADLLREERVVHPHDGVRRGAWSS